MNLPKYQSLITLQCATFYYYVINFVAFGKAQCPRYVGDNNYYWYMSTDTESKGKLISLHDRPWILPWIKPISNELDIIIHVIASQLSDHCDVISNRLQCHQQNEDRASETRGRCVKIVSFIVNYGFVMSCKKWNNVCTLVTNCFCTHSGVIVVFISHVASQLGK